LARYYNSYYNTTQARETLRIHTWNSCWLVSQWSTLSRPNFPGKVSLKIFGTCRKQTPTPAAIYSAPTFSSTTWSNWLHFTRPTIK